MRIRLLTAIAGVNWSAQVDDEIELSDQESRPLIAAGIAEQCRGTEETAAMRTTPPRGRRNRS